ncbi:TPA: hypothetical protein DCZ39_05640 [Patescibacteria group bacterium]|nr:hypothetical protein [Candidatus Gracilibacteria bacterium]
MGYIPFVEKDIIIFKIFFFFSFEAFIIEFIGNLYSIKIRFNEFRILRDFFDDRSCTTTDIYDLSRDKIIFDEIIFSF